MAQIGVPAASVLLNYGVGTKSAGTDSAGQYTHIAYLTEEQYDALPANFSIEAKKIGYNGAVASIAKPDFASAVANGIQVDAVISEIDPTQFGITPNSLEFTSAGGTATITVTAPDNTWDFEFSAWPDLMTVVRTNDTTISVTCGQNTSNSIRTGYLYVTWGESEIMGQIRSLRQ